MIGKLRIGLSRNPLTRCRRVMLKRHIFFMKLLGIAPQFHVRAIRLIGCVAVWHMIMIATRISTTATTTAAFGVLRLSHWVLYHIRY